MMVNSGWFTLWNGSFCKSVFSLPGLFIGLLVLTGCSTSQNASIALAPAPPDYPFTLSSDKARDGHASLGMIMPGQIEPGAGEVHRALIPSGIAALYPDVASGDGLSQDVSGGLGVTSAKSNGRCTIRDRFDNKSLLAYQWGRNRVGLNVRGVHVGDAQIQQVKIEYRLRLAAEKTRREKCLYDRSWQGLMGSGYNEFFLRENDTVWEDLREMRRDLENRLDDAF
ncbi:MAG: hypothetical protein KDI13_02035 [Alphaproteobacteria bacterium]|nr:hypothetical protein [Alphaproteobacteria bacterium]